MSYLWLVHFAIGIILISIYYNYDFEVDRSQYPCPDNVTQYSGYITVNNEIVNHYFYWFFESRDSPTLDPLILWIDRNPGCSALVSMLLQNGPCRMGKGDRVPVVNEDSWNSFATILYVDQPAGTGFSYSETPQEVKLDDNTIILELTAFLEAFYVKFPKYSKLPLFIMGYGYAGHFIPLFSTHILKNKQNLRTNLEGISIGNGWVDPKSHFSTFTDYMHKTRFIEDEDLPEVKVLRDRCLHQVDTNDPSAFAECMSYFQHVMNISETHAGRSINEFDVRRPCNRSNTLCYDLSNVSEFLNTENVQSWLGVTNISWTGCSVIADKVMTPGFLDKVVEEVAFTLEHGVRVLLYNGRDDLMCNYLGGQAWVGEMAWSEQSRFNSMRLVDWDFRGKIVGAFKTFANLTLVELVDAGHLAVMDQPVLGLQIMWTFLNNIPFGAFNYIRGED